MVSEHPSKRDDGDDAPHDRGAAHLAGLQAVLEASPNAIVAVDADGRITYVNPRVQATFGWPPSELIGHHVERLIPKRLTERHVAHRGGFLAHPAARPMGIGLDLAGRRRDGSEFPVEISLSPVATPEGPLIFATVVDITARKALESQLLQAQKMESVGRLAGGIAHDFNNMLFAISGYADLLLEDLEEGTLDHDGLLGSVEQIRVAADRAASLTGQLLAFSRQQVVSPRAIDVNASVSAVEPMLRRLIGANVRLVLALDPGAGQFRADAGQLDQVIVNLVVNARDALPSEGGTVTVETGNAEFDELYALEHFEVSAGPYVMLAVSDTGKGMDSQTREHIFEPFFTTKQQGQGTGLGLATTYGIVRQAGGHIWVYSEPGLGTTFKIYFPRIRAEATAEGAPQAADEPVGAGTVLLVEDEAVVRDLTTMVLERAGYRVIVASNATEATAIVEEQGDTIDVLVSDVVMPGGVSGVRLADHVLDRFPGVGVILVSGYTAETLDLEEVLKRGAGFLAKPFNKKQLTDAVARAVSRRRAGEISVNPRRPGAEPSA